LKHEGLSFPEAANRLAKRYGIEIPVKPLSAEQKRQINEREILLDLNMQAMDFYRRSLQNSAAGERARSYLSQRGLSQKTIADFKLGYALDGWDNLLNFFSNKGISPALIERTGLILPRKNKSGHYDRFRNRIIFPIFDANTHVVGFGGRVLDDSLPKYLNSPETPVYSKSRSLYGIQRAKEKCRISGTVFIVEGYLDLLALHQNGIENSVATLGTALTSDHVRLLTRYAGRIILVYDSDEAGIRSAQRCIGTFWKEHVDFRREDVFSEKNADTHILVLPAGHDPDSFVFEYGPEFFLKAASKAPGIITFLVDCAVNKYGLSTEGKIRIISELQEPLAAINDRVAQALYIKQLAERLGISEAAVLERIQERSAAKAKDRAYGASTHSAVSASQNLSSLGSASGENEPKGVEIGSRVERQIIAMMLQFPEVLPEISNRNVLEYFENDTLKSIGESILKFNPTSVGQVSELISQIDDKKYRIIIAALAMIEESWNWKGCLKLLTKFAENNQKLQDRSLIDEQIRAAERNNDHELLLRLLNEKQKMAVRSEKQKMALLSGK
jgi:DNA primase